ncbi:MAG: deoxyribose-phosphate aldolase [Phycisphaerales bacterium]|nr:deoxyribose-phosphate aldolase [Phycisphaerales bacterium]
MSPPVDTVMLARRAAELAKRSIKTTAKAQGLRMAVSMLDLTTLEGADTPGRVKALCAKALYPCPEPLAQPVPMVAAACVYPRLVPVAWAALRDSPVKVASVATAFPSGQSGLDLRLRETEAAVAAGADEIDMVISRGLFLSGRHTDVVEEIRMVRAAAGAAHVKVILETGELETADNIRRACDLVLEAVADDDEINHGDVFLKTSTGKVSPAATPVSVLVLLEAARAHARATGVRLGIKPAGGIRTAKQALHMLVMVQETLGPQWLTPTLFRIGASSLLDDLIRQLLKMEHGRYTGMDEVALT